MLSHLSLAPHQRTPHMVQMNRGECFAVKETRPPGTRAAADKTSLATGSHFVFHAVRGALLDTKDYLGSGRMWKVSRSI